MNAILFFGALLALFIAAIWAFEWWANGRGD